MRIGNIQPSDGPRRIDHEPRRTADRLVRSPEEHTGDLLALSAGVSLRGMLDTAATNREAAIQEIADAFRSGAYRPDPERLANKLLEWGFDPQ